jgi:anti-sigma factor RsiW
MRCRDVSRAIAALPGAMTESEIQAHLAACPRCAAMAEGVRRLDRLWDATRPEPPSAASWDSAWARIEHELAAAPQPVPGDPSTIRTLPMTARAPMARLGIGLALIAAAVLLALNLPRPATQFADNGAGHRAEPVYGTLDVPVGHTVLYHVDSDEHRVVQVSEPMASAEDDLTFFRQSELGLDSVDYFALFGWFEAMPALTASAPPGETASPFDSRP